MAIQHQGAPHPNDTYEVRSEALHYAMRLIEQTNQITTTPSPGYVVETAEKFKTFLMGQ